MNMINHSGYLKAGPHSPNLSGSGKSVSSNKDSKILKTPKSSIVSRIYWVEILFDFLAMNNLLFLYIYRDYSLQVQSVLYSR
jgi:hypothetical protein